MASLEVWGQTFITAEEKAECFASFFSDKSTIPEAENSKAIPHLPQKTTAKCKKVIFWPKQVRKQLQKLDVNKASGPDSIPALVLRNAAAELASPLAQPLMPSHTLLNVSPIPSTTGKKLGSCVWTSAKHLIEYDIRVSWLNYTPLALLANCSTGWQTT